MRVFIYLLLFTTSLTGVAQKLSGNTFSTKNGAIDGYDVVAYFTDTKPTLGNEKFAVEWNNATWYFATVEHKNIFKADPQKYAPQFGGFCSYGVSKGYKVKIDPQAWDIQDGKLYLNYDLEVQKIWRKDKPNYVQKAIANWDKIKAE
jgi:YHS domain-containing protein